MIRYADIVVDLQAGDTGKGKVSHWLAKNYQYDYVLRYNGGANAGHTIYHNGQKVITHQVPVGAFYGIPCIIGPGCVVNIPRLYEELDMLKRQGFTPTLYVDKRCHITTPSHIAEDSQDTKIGTTRQGIGPTYRDKYARTGNRLVDLVKYNDFTRPYQMIDTYELLHNKTKEINVLCEGAQGFQIDIDWGDYPYVTSSHCTSGAVALNGVPPRTWRNIYGIMKAYETYSGFKKFNQLGNEETFEKIQEAGQEFGATTGRKRQVSWMNLDGVLRAMHINDITDLIINKVDVLDAVGEYGVVYMNQVQNFTDGKIFREFVETTIQENYKYHLNGITWSTSPEAV